MASTYLSRTPASAGTQTKATISVWLKRANLTSNQCYFSTGNNNVVFKFASNDKLTVYDYNGVSMDLELTTTQLFRDTSAWYHIVVSLDSTQATASDRAKLYVNGSLISNFDSTTYPTQNYNFKVNGTLEHFIGRLSGLSQYFDGSLAHFHNIDGTAYDATAFGEYDANGVWKIKTSPSVTYGTNGFFILKDGNSVTDQSGNTNNFTVAGGTLTKTEDSPSNVFATLNPNYQSTFDATSRAVLANGNTKWTGTTNATSQNGILSTLGASSGKWYLEAKWIGTNDATIGVAKEDFGMMTAGTGGLQSAGWYGMNTNISASGGAGMAWYTNNSATGDRGNTISTSDIIMMAIDIDNNKLYFGKNGTWEESGDPTSGAAGTGATSTLASDTTYLVACANYGYAIANSWEFNFGNGYFGTTAVASAGTNASGIGIFEFDVPTGYTALSTKGLNL